MTASAGARLLTVDRLVTADGVARVAWLVVAPDGTIAATGAGPVPEGHAALPH